MLRGTTSLSCLEVGIMSENAAACWNREKENLLENEYVNETLSCTFDSRRGLHVIAEKDIPVLILDGALQRF